MYIYTCIFLYDPQEFWQPVHNAPRSVYEINQLVIIVIIIVIITIIIMTMMIMMTMMMMMMMMMMIDLDPFPRSKKELD